MKPKHYTLSDLYKLWERYTTTTGLRLLVDGKWQYNFDVKGVTNINATRAETCMLKNVMSFPEYMETLEKNGS